MKRGENWETGAERRERMKIRTIMREMGKRNYYAIAQFSARLYPANNIFYLHFFMQLNVFNIT